MSKFLTLVTRRILIANNQRKNIYKGDIIGSVGDRGSLWCLEDIQLEISSRKMEINMSGPQQRDLGWRCRFG